MARHIKGAGRIGKLLRAAPQTIRGEIARAMDKGGRSILAVMKARAPTRSGRLKAGLDYKVAVRSLRLKVGLLKTKSGRSDLFYGRIQDLGRKEQTVKVRRARTQPYVMRVRGAPGKRFVTGQFTELRTIMRNELRGLFNRALRALSGD